MEAGDELKAKLAQRAQRSGDASGFSYAVFLFFFGGGGLDYSFPGSQVIDETSARRNSLKESLGLDLGQLQLFSVQ